MKEEIKYNLAEKMVIYAISVIGGILLITVALLAASALCLATDMGESFSTLVAGICLGLGTMFSGFLASKKIKYSGLINGMFCGFIIYLAVFIFSLFLSENGFTIISLSHLLISVISSAIGGILGVNASQKRRIV